MDKDFRSWWEELKEDVSEYFQARLHLTKLQVYEKIARVVGVIFSFFLLFLIVGLVIIFLLIMIGGWVSVLTDSYAIGFSVMAGMVLILFVLLLAKRKKWLEQPVSDRVIKALLDNEEKKSDGTEE